MRKKGQTLVRKFGDILEGKQYKNESDVHDFLRKINIPRFKTQGTMHRIAVNSHFTDL